MTRVVGSIVAVVIVSVLIATITFAPQRACRLIPLGDEGEGECLGFVARGPRVTRCRVVSALVDEIRGSQNDVVISSALEGLVETRACQDISLLWTRVSKEASAQAVQLVAAAALACIEQKPYSLGEARSVVVPSIPANVRAEADRSKCN